MSGLSGKPPLGIPNYAPGCCVCGSHLNSCWLEEDTPYLNDEKWTRTEQGKALFLDAQELESKYIDADMPDIWSSFFRLFMYDPSKGEFALTGIGQHFHWRFSAPKNAAKAFAGVPPVDRKDFTEIYPYCFDLGWWNYLDESTNVHDFPIGIHMSCWKLAQWKIGPGLMDNIELFIAIALRTNFRILYKIRHGNPGPWKLYEMATMNSSRYDDLIKRQIELFNKNMYEWPGRVDHDPFRNPCTRKIIDSSKRIRKEVSFAQPLVPDLPLEILSEILDFLDCKDVSRSGIAFRITIPDCYWRSRVASNLVEFNEIAEEDLHWQYLCVKLEAVYATDESLESRRYILDLLSNKIEPVYLQNLGERDFPRLEEVIVECLEMIEWRCQQGPDMRLPKGF